MTLTRSKSLGGALIATLLSVAFVAGPMGQPAAAKTINVSTAAQFQSALFDLREDNSGPHTVNITSSFTLGGTALPVYTGPQPLTINGNGHTVRSTSSDAVFLFFGDSRVTVKNITVKDFRASFSPLLGSGDVAIENSTFDNNRTGDGGHGGAVFTHGHAQVRNSTFSGNRAGTGGAIFADEGITIMSSTFTGNTATAHGGATSSAGETTVYNSTFHGNSAATAAGAIDGGRNVALTHATFWGNRAPVGAHVRVTGTISSFTSFGTVMANGAGGGDACRISSATQASSQGYNYIEDSSCALDLASDVTNGSDAKLGSLSRNGGPTRTLFPGNGSELVNAIPPGNCVIEADQRGAPRPHGGACDIGAVEALKLPFPDIAFSNEFIDEITWLAGSGITGGYSDGTFRPSAQVSRQAMAAFLYRFAGEPSFSAPSSPTFPDVGTGHEFFHEIEWLASTEITGGYSDGRFRPGSNVSRQAMAAFLYRFAGEPDFDAPSSRTFPDVRASHDFFHEIEWLSTTGITGGYSDGTYRPSSNVSRQAMAAFLYRFDQM